jgi:hypothetical protein
MIEFKYRAKTVFPSISKYDIDVEFSNEINGLVVADCDRHSAYKSTITFYKGMIKNMNKHNFISVLLHEIAHSIDYNSKQHHGPNFKKVSRKIEKMFENKYDIAKAKMEVHNEKR